MDEARDAVYDYFNNNLDNKIAEIEAETGISIERIGYLSKGETKRPVYPRIKILADRTVHDYGYENQPLTRPWLLHYFVIWIDYTSGSIETVENTLMWYTEAINRITEDDASFNDAFVDVRLGDEDYSPMMESEKTKELIQGVSIELLCKSR